MNPLPLIICISLVMSVTSFKMTDNPVYLRTCKSGCDEVLFNPSVTFSTKNISFDYGTDNAKLLIESNLYVKNLFSRVRSTCQTLFSNSTNLSLVGDHYYSTRIPSEVLVFTDKEILTSISKKMSYDLTQITTMTDSKDTIKIYSAVEDRRWRHIKVAYTYFPPYLFKNSGGKLTGISFDVWKILEVKLDLKLSFTHKHNTYIENYQKLGHGLVDLAMPQDSLWISQYQIADPTHFLFFERFMFFNIKPGPVTTLLTLIYPFESFVWLLLGFSFLFACIAIYLINLKSHISCFHTFQILLSPILSDPLPKVVQKSHMNWYGYALLFIWPLSGLLLSAAYSSNLLANLSVVGKESSDNTFEDLVKNKRTLGMPKGTILEVWMKNSPREIVRRVEKECVRDRDGYYDGLPQEVEHPHMKDRLERGEASSIVTLSIYPKVEHKYRLGTDVLMDTFSTYYMRRRHPMKPYVDLQMGRLTDAGITLHIKDKYVWEISRFGRDYERYHAQAVTHANKITIQHLYPLWIILGFGFFIAVASFMGETCLKGINIGYLQKRHGKIHLIYDSETLFFI